MYSISFSIFCPKPTVKSWISTSEKSSTSCPNWGEGMLVIRAMPEKMHSFPQETVPNNDNWGNMKWSLSHMIWPWPIMGCSKRWLFYWSHFRSTAVKRHCLVEMWDLADHQIYFIKKCKGFGVGPTAGDSYLQGFYPLFHESDLVPLFHPLSALSLKETTLSGWKWFLEISGKRSNHAPGHDIQLGQNKFTPPAKEVTPPVDQHFGLPLIFCQEKSLPFLFQDTECEGKQFWSQAEPSKSHLCLRSSTAPDKIKCSFLPIAFF